MTVWRYIARSLRFYWRTHLGVVLGAALGTAIIVGALAVGDSVRYSLREIALARLGEVDLALNGDERFFRSALADELSRDLNATVAPVLNLRGVAIRQGAGVRCNHVQILGVDERFWRLGHTSDLLGGRSDGVVVSTNLAQRLGLQPGDDLLLRVEKPSLLSRDAPMSTAIDYAVTLHLTVAAVASDREFGRFSLLANQVAPFNAFVDLTQLQRRIGRTGRANTLLLAASPGRTVTTAAAEAALRRHLQLADGDLSLDEVPGKSELELRTGRIFLERPLAAAALSASPQARGVLTYFVNELRVGDRSTPYSIVAALQGPPVPPDMKDDEILINQWLADDLQAHPGDTVKITYFVVGPMRRLVPRTSRFRIRAVIPISGAAADPSLMPDFPGLEDVKNCRDWEPGVPIHLDRIRDKDEAYWDAYRGTPKAFLTLKAGQRIWDNRFGNLTAVRFPAQPGIRSRIDKALLADLKPELLGLFFQPVRRQALAAASQSMDFGQLFVGFSFFLIAAALILVALLFAFGIEQRAEEVGLLLALGYPPRKVQRLMLGEGAVLSLCGGLIGAVSGVAYTRLVIRGLATIWRSAVAATAVQYHAQTTTLISGAVSGFAAALLVIWFVIRKQAAAPARELLASGGEHQLRVLPASASRRRPGLICGIASIVVALAIIALAGAGQGEKAAGAFFTAGTLLLVGGICFCRALLARFEQAAAAGSLSVVQLGFRSTTRRPGRSLATAILLACGSFLVVAIGASRHDPGEGAELRSSGTGGFALFGESTLPVYDDLNSAAGREAFGIDAAAVRGTGIVPFRVHSGDDASCLNLNRAQTPRLLGVRPEALAQRHAFTFVKTVDTHITGSPWQLLTRAAGRNVIPAIGDQNTVVWSLHKSVGGLVPYIDAQGQTFYLQIVGIIGNSVLQGSLVIAESAFIARFPAESGYRLFLIDAPHARADAVSRTLAGALQDVGLDLTPAPQRLEEFAAVENTYLSIFALLGGLGLLLGSIGLGAVVLRNVLERRPELALLRAVGFRRRTLHQLIFSEHCLLLGMGLGTGVAAAVIAVVPALRSPGAHVPYALLAETLAAVAVSGFFWTGLATAVALHGALLPALRNE